MQCKDIRRRLDAFIDDELDPQFVQAISTHLNECPLCREEHRNLVELRKTLKAGGRWPVPEGLEKDMLEAIDTAQRSSRKTPAPVSRGWWPFAAGLAAGVVAGIGLHWGVMQPMALKEALADNLVSAHVESQLADHFVDIASSDQHSVKPWFVGKIDYAVPVKDLSASGFELLGGRLDFVNGKTVAALAYGYRKHRLNLFVWPERYWQQALPGDTTRRGYTLLYWNRDGLSFSLISDLNPADLKRFQALYTSVH